MKTAVMFTGALRTIKKTVPFLKKNCLLHEDVHVYACLQNDTETSNEDWEAWLRQELGNHLQTVQWTHNVKDPFWAPLRCRLVDNLEISEQWKGFLHNTGPVVEYYQLYLAYKDLFRLEKRQGVPYEYIVRCRTDTIFCKPLDFHWLHWTEEEIQQRLEILETQMKEKGVPQNPDKRFQLFMTTVLDDALITNLDKQWGYYFPAEDTVLPQTPSEIRAYLQKGRYALTFRENLLYIIKRAYFYSIPSIGMMYGMYTSPHSDQWWFNAEGQFKSACYHSGLTMFDYCTSFEADSLYSYEHDRYFDEHENLKNPLQAFCLIRK